MTVPRSRAWRFGLPMMLSGPVGLTISNRGDVMMVDGEETIRQAILLLLSTTPGERVMRPTYGCDLRRLAFMPNDETTAGLAIHHVRTSLNRYEPRIDVLAVDAGADVEEPDHLTIQIDYRVRASKRTGSLSLSLALFSGHVP